MSSYYKNESGTFEVSNADGTKLELAWQRWTPNSGAKAGHDVIYQHGLGEHCGRITNLLKTLEGTGITVSSYDMRGHGKSQGKQGAARDVGQLAEDLGAYVDFCKEKFGVQKPLIYGHSLGGAVVCNYLGYETSNQDKFCAAVITSPSLAVEKTLYQTVMAKVLTCLKSLIPNICVDSGLSTDNLSRDKAVVEEYRNDPLTHGYISVSLAFSILHGGDALIDTASAVKLPIFMAHGEKDLCTAPRGSKAYFEKCASDQKTLKMYPGCVHELHNEVAEDRDKFLAEIKAFIVEQLEKK